MKKTILFASALFAMLLTTTSVSAQGTPAKDDVSNPAGGDMSGKDDKGGNQGSDDAMKCCPKKLILSIPAKTKGGKATNKVLSSSILKGNEGKDLSYDIVDAGGTSVPGAHGAVSKNAAGELVIDGGKLGKGKKYTFKFKAGTKTQSVAFTN